MVQRRHLSLKSKAVFTMFAESLLPETVKASATVVIYLYMHSTCMQTYKYVHAHAHVCIYIKR